MKSEEQLAKLVERLTAAYGRDLVSVVLYGSAATGEFQERRSDLNVLCVLRDVEVAALQKAERIANWWRAFGYPAPLLFGQDELRRSADAFSIEFRDIRDQHRVLYGDDPVAAMELAPDYHRVQVEHELRAKLIALRQRYLGIHRDRRAVVALMVDSLASFAALFRHALLLAGHAQPPARKREILEQAARTFEFDAAPFLSLLDLREGNRKRSQVEAASTFEAYYRGISAVCNGVDLLARQKESA